MRKGQSFLALTVFIGTIVAIVGVLVAFFAQSYVNTGYGLAAQAQAESVANSGVQDAILRLSRDSSWAPSPDPYTLAVGSSTATVTVTQNSPVSGEVTILSVATVALRIRKIQAVLQINASTTQVSIVSRRDVQ